MLGLGRWGYFIPYRYAGRISAVNNHYQWLDAEFSRECDGLFSDVLKDIASFRADLEAISGGPPAPRWTQDWFPGLDAAAAYALVRAVKPTRILEIGSGHSTRFLMRAVRDGGLSTRMTCIDPAPRADVAGLDLDLRRMPIQSVGLETIPALESGDFLFVDSSHIAMPGSDVDWILNNLIPGLPKGVFVHFHDLFLPDPYPAHWEWRGYNEQIVVAALLIGRRMNPVFSSHFVRARRPDLLDAHGLTWIPLPDGAIESSLWMVTTSGSAAPVERAHADGSR